MSINHNELPTGWATVRVDRVGAVRLGRQRSPDKHTGEHATKYLRAANIRPTGFDLTDLLEMDFTPAERFVFALRAGDILLTEASGSSSQVGRAALWREELSDCCYQNTIIRFRPHATLPDYALAVFRHYAAAGIFGRIARGVGIQHIGAGRFAELQFPLPPINEQKRIAEAVNRRLAEIREAGAHLRSALTRIGAQRKEILAAAVSGELVITPEVTNEGKNPPSKLEASRRGPEVPQGSLFESIAEGLEQPEVVLGALPPGWTWTRIHHVGDARLGRQRSPEHHRGKHLRPYLRVANVLEDRIDVSQVQVLS
jgi:type I restriction enzyme, S subunit